MTYESDLEYTLTLREQTIKSLITERDEARDEAEELASELADAAAERDRLDAKVDDLIFVLNETGIERDRLRPDGPRHIVPGNGGMLEVTCEDYDAYVARSLSDLITERDTALREEARAQAEWRRLGEQVDRLRQWFFDEGREGALARLSASPPEQED